jgi:hypothetical protein
MARIESSASQMMSLTVRRCYHFQEQGSDNTVFTAVVEETARTKFRTIFSVRTLEFNVQFRLSGLTFTLNIATAMFAETSDKFHHSTLIPESQSCGTYFNFVLDRTLLRPMSAHNTCSNLLFYFSNATCSIVAKVSVLESRSLIG